MPGDYNHDLEAPYKEIVTLDTERTMLQSDAGVVIEGTIHVNAPGVRLRELTIVGPIATITFAKRA